MNCLSINYKKADVSVRQRFSFDAEKRAKIRSILGTSVLLCTCNRTELYFTETNLQQAIDILEAYSGHVDIADFLCVYKGQRAIRHLFRVASGIESMIIGEDEILRQIKEAYAESFEFGSTNQELNIIFQAAISTAKRVKTETDLSKIPVSAATIAANEAAKYAGTVLIIGASGKIGSATLKNLNAHKNIRIIQTGRSHSPGTICFENIETVPYHERYRYADTSDCIISATASPHYTLTTGHLREVLKIEKPRLLIDLAVPPDIEKTVTQLAGIKLIGIDDIGRIAQHGNELKISAAEKAEIMISEDVDNLMKKIAYLRFLPTLQKMLQSAEVFSLEQLVYKLRDGLNSEQFAAVLGIIETLGE